MGFSQLLEPSAQTPVILSIVFLLLIYWVRRPDRKRDLSADKADV